jgi:hypothetical protein
VRLRRLAEPGLVLVLAIAATAILTHPLAPKMDRVGRVNTADGQFSIWNVAWVAEQLVRDPLHVYDANIFYPHRNTLAWSEANLGAGLLAIPAWWATRNPYFAHNLVVFVAFVASVCGAYALARRLTGHPGAAAFAGIAFAFCPFIYARTAHIQLLMTAGLPWSLWACHRLVERASVGRAVALGAVLVAQGLSCAYYGVFAGLSVGLALLFYAFARGRYRDRRYWITVAVAAVVAIGGILPFFLPYLRVEGADFSRALEEASDYSAGWRAYLASPTWAHRWMLPAASGHREVAFPGFLAVSLAAMAVLLVPTRRLDSPAVGGDAPRPWPAPPRETVAFYGLLAALACWTSTGPAGGLYTVLYHVLPVFGFLRAPGRAAIVVTLGLVICASVVVAWLARTLRRGALVATLLTLAAAAELTAVPLPIPEVDPVPHPVYRALRRLPRAPVAEFPFFWLRHDFPRHAAYMLNSTAHWLPLVNGYSDHIPTDFREMVVDVSSFPSRAAFRHLEQRRVRYVVFHTNWYDSRSLVRLRERLDDYGEFLAPILRHEGVWLYEITSWPE